MPECFGCGRSRLTRRRWWPFCTQRCAAKWAVAEARMIEADDDFARERAQQDKEDARA